MIYYNGGNTPLSTQSSLTNKALLIKHFIVLALTCLCYLTVHPGISVPSCSRSPRPVRLNLSCLHLHTCSGQLRDVCRIFKNLFRTESAATLYIHGRRYLLEHGTPYSSVVLNTADACLAFCRVLPAWTCDYPCYWIRATDRLGWWVPPQLVSIGCTR